MKSIYTPKEAAVYIARLTGDLNLTERDVFERIKKIGLLDGFLSVVIQAGTALQYQTGGNVDEWKTYAMPTPRELFVGGHFAVDFVEQLSLTGFGLPGQLSNALLPPHNQRFSTTTPIPAADVRLPKRLVINLLSPYHRLILDIESGEINLDHAFTEINNKANVPTVVQSNPAPAVGAAKPAPVDEVALMKPEKVGPKFDMTKAAMVAQHVHEWPTIERDITDASENGLAAAKAGPRGWHELDAMAWARANNKLVNASKSVSALTQGVNMMVSVHGRKHKLEG